jgi:hypothetical protein
MQEAIFKKGDLVKIARGSWTGGAGVIVRIETVMEYVTAATHRASAPRYRVWLASADRTQLFLASELEAE